MEIIAPFPFCYWYTYGYITEDDDDPVRESILEKMNGTVVELISENGKQRVFIQAKVVKIHRPQNDL